METADITAEAVDRANELYWGSDHSVNQIADELDLSKGALYGLIRPLVVGRGCPECGEEVAFSNRTAKDRGRLDCPGCEWKGVLEETVDLGIAEAGDGGGKARTPARRRSALPDGLDSERLRTMAGGALLGAAVGLALVLWARRR